MIAYINVSSNQVMQKSTEISNTPTFSTHIVMQIMQEIFLAGDMSPRNLTSSIVPSLTGAKIKSDTHRSSYNVLTKEMYTGVIDKNWIKTSIDQLVTP